MGCLSGASIHLKSCDRNLRTDGRFGSPARCVSDLAIEEQRCRTSVDLAERLSSDQMIFLECVDERTFPEVAHLGGVNSITPLFTFDCRKRRFVCHARS